MEALGKALFNTIFTMLFKNILKPYGEEVLIFIAIVVIAGALYYIVKIASEDDSADQKKEAKPAVNAVSENKQISSEHESVYCTNCGFKAYPGDKFCYKCGHKLE